MSLCKSCAEWAGLRVRSFWIKGRCKGCGRRNCHLHPTYAPTTQPPREGILFDLWPDPGPTPWGSDTQVHNLGPGT